MVSGQIQTPPEESNLDHGEYLVPLPLVSPRHRNMNSRNYPNTRLILI